MEETYYYSQGRRIAVSRLQSARVVRLPENREAVSLPGWRSIPLGNRRFQLLVRADAVPERALRITRLEELVEQLRAAERQIGNQPRPDEERFLRAQIGEQIAPALLSNQGALFLPTGEVVAKFRSDLDPRVVERTLQLLGRTVVKRLSFLPNAYLLQPGGDGLNLANGLVEAGFVEFASPNFIEEMPWRDSSLPPNELFPQQWHLHNVGQNGSRAKADVRALDAWQITTGSPNITICIIDSGVDSRHEAFTVPGKVVAGFDFEDSDPFADPTTSSHGTSCAGVATAPWGVGRVVGIAPNCRLMPIRRAVLSEHLKIAEAFVWAADHGADVISCSFGYDYRPWVLPDIVRAAIDQTVTTGRNGKGCVIAWAAGNGNELVTSDEWASYNKVLAVAASTDEDLRASYSDYGPEIDVCAPSSGGRNGVTTTSNGGYTDQFGGTSAAAPLAAGIAALVLSVNPNLTWREVHDILRQSADRIDSANGNYDSDGHSRLYGYGRVNAYRALNAISALKEAVRASDVEPRLPLLYQFSARFLESQSAGMQILGFLSNRRFRILKLLETSAFRQAAVSILRATADVFDAFQRGTAMVIANDFWQAISYIAPLLLSENRESRGERSLTLDEKEPTMSVSSSGSGSGGEGTRSVPAADQFNAALKRLEQVLRGEQPTERDAPGASASTPAITSSLRMEEFLEAASHAVLRAIEVRQQASDERALGKRFMIPPITVGIIYWPGGQSPVAPQV